MMTTVPQNSCKVLPKMMPDTTWREGDEGPGDTEGRRSR